MIGLQIELRRFLYYWKINISGKSWCIKSIKETINAYNLTQEEIFTMIQNDPPVYQHLLEEDEILAKGMAMISDKLISEIKKDDQKITSFDQYTAKNKL